MRFQAERLNAEIDRRVLSNDEAAREIGVPEKTLRRWRHSEVEPRRANVRRMAAVFERDPAWFYAVPEDVAA